MLPVTPGVDGHEAPWGECGGDTWTGDTSMSAPPRHEWGYPWDLGDLGDSSPPRMCTRGTPGSWDTPTVGTLHGTHPGRRDPPTSTSVGTPPWGPPQ